MTISHVNNYNVNINKVSKSGKNEKPIWNGKKPYKYLEDFGDAALAYDKKLKQYYTAKTVSDGAMSVSDLKKQISETFPEYTLTNQNRKEAVRGTHYLYISDSQLQKMADDPVYRGRVYGLMDGELTVSKEFTLTYSDGRNVTQHCAGSFFSLDESNSAGIDGLPYLGGCMTDGGFSSTESHPQVRNQSFIYDNLEPKKSSSKTNSAAKAMAEKTAKKRAEKKHAERKSEAKKVADKRQAAVEEKRDLEKEQLQEIWEEKQTSSIQTSSIQTYSNSGDDMVKEVEPSGSQFNFTA